MAPKQIKSKVALHKVFQRRVGERCLSLGAKLLNMHVLRRTQIKHGGTFKVPPQTTAEISEIPRESSR